MEIHGVLSHLMVKMCLVEKQNKQIMMQLSQTSKVEEELNQKTCSQTNQERSIQKDQDRSVETNEVTKPVTVEKQAKQEASIQRHLEMKKHTNKEKTEQTNAERISLAMERQTNTREKDIQKTDNEFKVNICSYSKYFYALKSVVDEWK